MNRRFHNFVIAVAVFTLSAEVNAEPSPVETIQAKSTASLKLSGRGNSGTTYLTFRTPRGSYSMSTNLTIGKSETQARRFIAAKVAVRRNPSGADAALVKSGSHYRIYLKDRRRGHALLLEFPQHGGAMRPVRISTSRFRLGMAAALASGNSKVAPPIAIPVSESSLGPLVPRRRVRVAVDVDTEFADAVGVGYADKIKEWIFASSVLYGSQLGIVIELAAIGSPVSGAENYATSADAPTLLNLFRNYSLKNQQLGVADAYVLLTGKRLRGSYIGIAFQDSACFEDGTYAFAVIQKVRPVVQPILIAHELAHILGAQHDDSSGSSVMNMFVSAEDTSFSSISRRQVVNYVREHAQCLEQLVEPGVTLAATLKSRLLSITASLFNVDPSTCSLSLTASGNTAKLTSVTSQSSRVEIVFTPPTGISSYFPITVTVNGVPNMKTAKTIFLGVTAQCAGEILTSPPIALRIPAETVKTLRKTAPNSAAGWLQRLL